MINAVIFDMDGVIFDTERILLKCMKKAGEKHNIQISDENVAKLRGTNSKTFKELFLEMYPNTDFYNIKMETNRLKEEDILKNGLPIKSGIENLFKYIKEKGLKMGLASSTKQETVMRYLIQSKLVNYFDCIICGDMIKNGKPEPDIYLEVCDSLGVSPNEALVLEDSKNGILAGYRAGCNVLMVIDIDEHYEETKDMIIGKIRDYKEAEMYI